MNDKKKEVQPASAWLLNCILNKHADMMDNFPQPNVLPREEGDKEEAKKLTSIIPVVLDHCNFEQTYSDVAMAKIKSGTGVYGIFWDSEALNGLGDISIRQVDVLSLYWEPGIKDIQKSRNLFCVDVMDNEVLQEMYPTLKNLGGSGIDVKEYIYDDNVDTTDKSVVVDWYYRKYENGRSVLHYCKYVNNTVLFATENDRERFPNGLYDHNMYPFVFDTLYEVEGSPAGFGFIDIGKDCQSYIDRGNQAIMENMLSNTRPRYFVRKDGAVNEAEYMDLTRDLVHVDGNLGQDSVRPIDGKSLNGIYVTVLNNKIDELKETTGNRDVSSGGSTGGVTSASGIASMQEAGSKLSRDISKASYRAFRKVIYMVIELIRQFYDMPRCFRIMGDNASEEYVEFSNAGIVPQAQGNINPETGVPMEMGVEVEYRLPVFDIEVTAQKQSPYSKMAQNDLALQFYSAGFFNPQLSDQALACLDMMDFDRKSFVTQTIQKNGTMLQMIQALQQQMIMLAGIVDQDRGSNLQAQYMAQFSGGAPVAPITGQAPDKRVIDNNSTLGGSGKIEEAKVTKDARTRVAESTAPN